MGFEGYKKTSKKLSSNSSCRDKSCWICDSSLVFHLTKACSQQALSQISPTGEVGMFPLKSAE